MVLSFDIGKGDVRVSKWSAKTLTKVQKTYAALDAYASLEVYRTADKFNFISPTSQISTPTTMDSALSPAEEQKLFMTKVKLDSFHAFQRIETPRHHPFQQEFANAFRDAMFIIDPVDKQAVARVLDTEGISFDDKFSADSDWILSRCRRHIPESTVLTTRLTSVLEEFRKEKYIDPDSKKPLLGPRFKCNSPPECSFEEDSRQCATIVLISLFTSLSSPLPLLS